MARAGFHEGGREISNRGDIAILIAPDSFKGSLSAREAAEAMREGVRDALPGAVAFVHPISDGGEGLLDVLLPAMGGNSTRRS